MQLGWAQGKVLVAAAPQAASAEQPADAKHLAPKPHGGEHAAALGVPILLELEQLVCASRRELREGGGVGDTCWGLGARAEEGSGYGRANAGACPATHTHLLHRGGAGLRACGVGCVHAGTRNVPLLRHSVSEPVRERMRSWGASLPCQTQSDTSI